MKLVVVKVAPGSDGLIVWLSDETTLVEITLTPEAPWFDDLREVKAGEPVTVSLLWAG